MKMLITGASSGAERDMARVLAAMDVDLTLVTRRGDWLRELKREFAVSVGIVILDVSVEENCLALYQRFRNDFVDILINNMSFGNFGEFMPMDLDKELNVVSTNVQAVHILSKLFLRDFVKKNRGYILNVASSAVFLPGLLMATYHATRAYAERLTLAMHKELQKRSSHASVGALCSGPIQTEFDRVANVRFMMKGKTSMNVVSYTIRGMFKRKTVMIPEILMKGNCLLRRRLPLSVQMETLYHTRHRRDRQANTCISK